MPSPNDYAAVRTVLDTYIDACKSGDVGRLKSVFHNDSLMAGFLDGNFDLGTPEPFYNEVEELDPPVKSGEAYQAEIPFIHIAGPLASAAIVEDAYLGHDYVNHFHLLKIDGAWKIVSKIYNSVR